MEAIPNYTFDFTKDPPFKDITKKYFIEWITVGENQEKYVLAYKDFDSFEEARDYNNNNTDQVEEGIGFVFRNRRYLCQIK